MLDKPNYHESLEQAQNTKNAAEYIPSFNGNNKIKEELSKKNDTKDLEHLLSLLDEEFNNSTNTPEPIYLARRNGLIGIPGEEPNIIHNDTPISEEEVKRRRKELHNKQMIKNLRPGEVYIDTNRRSHIGKVPSNDNNDNEGYRQINGSGNSINI